MKPLAEIRKSKLSSYMMPLLGVLFVFSLSIHTHKISISPDALSKIAGGSQEAGHSVEMCSACILHGSIRLATACPVFKPIDPGLSISYNENELLAAYSLFLNSKTSRSPPAV